MTNNAPVQPDSNEPRGAWWRQLTVFAFLFLVAGIGVRSLVCNDSRFGFGMFGEHMEYLIVYHWIDEHGHRRQYFPGDELRDKSTHLRPRRGESAFEIAGRADETRYGTGAVRCWIDSYLDYLYEHSRPNDAVAIEAKLYYSINEHLVVGEPITFQEEGMSFPVTFDPVPDRRVTAKTIVFRHPSEAPTRP